MVSDNARQRRKIARVGKRLEWKAKLAARKPRPEKPRRIRSTKPSPASVARRRGKHSGQHIDRVRVARQRKATTKRGNSIARASRRRNRA